MVRKLYLHAGAHRTGTSSFQLCLAANRQQLETEGYDLAYPGRDGAPEGHLHLRLPKPSHGEDQHGAFVGKVTRALKKHVSGEDQPLVLSEENLLGLIIHFFSGRLYPARRKRLRVFRDELEAVGAEAEHILLIVRPYGDLFVSGFRKHAEDNAVEPFETHAEAMAAFRGGWPEAVKALQNVLKPKSMTVVEYGARGTSSELLVRLLGAEAGAYVEPEYDLNVSATDAALEHLQGIYQAGKVLEREDWQAVITEFAEHGEDRGFARFSEAQSEALATRYRDDLALIGSMEGVTLRA
ncbi:MAG: hypothetical protein P8O11_12075 [Lentibacter sp.]|uniref:hypothetical protein n=1 Tax=Lentibacter sp. TaxID=2024994 RepID=UPI00263946EA|nr:hypothetical protein [Lentibacter sp.]MDG1290432.1 hypothetical protein [Lentibacter sp.]